MTFEHLISLVLLALGVGFLSWSVWELVQAFSSRRWPTAPGVIVVSDLQRSTDTDGGYMYRPEVSYRYVVNGAEFVAGRARFGDHLSLSWSAPALRIVQKYRTGAEVEVRYDRLVRVFVHSLDG